MEFGNKKMENTETLDQSRESVEQAEQVDKDTLEGKLSTEQFDDDGDETSDANNPNDEESTDMKIRDTTASGAPAGKFSEEVEQQEQPINEILGNTKEQEIRSKELIEGFDEPFDDSEESEQSENGSDEVRVQNDVSEHNFYNEVDEAPFDDTAETDKSKTGDDTSEQVDASVGSDDKGEESFDDTAESIQTKDGQDTLEDDDVSDYSNSVNNETGTNNALVEESTGVYGEDSKIDNEKISSRFSAENFRLDDSFDSYAKKNYPELGDLKAKCVRDVQPMGTPDDQIDRSPNGKQYEDSEIKFIKETRDSIDTPNEATVMQKVIGVDTGNVEKDLEKYLNPTTPNNEAQVYGFVAKAEDTAPFTKTPQDCYDNLRLDYTGTPYVDPDQSVYVVRFTDGENYETPYSTEFGGNISGLSPFTGNGFVSSSEACIPEYTVIKDTSGNGAIVTDGEIYRINPDGSEEAVAFYDKDFKIFMLCEEEN